MREIKFRAWDNVGKVMVDWGTIRQTAFNTNGEYGLMYKVMTCGRHGGDLTPMQFTGLTDVSGNEIFEGDIVQNGDRRMVVVYQAPSFVMKEKIKSGYSQQWGAFICHPDDNQFQKVIGNIHQNPDLLK